MSGISGMTVYERLFANGLLEAWDAALVREDRQAMIQLLRKVELSAQAHEIADEALKRRAIRSN